MRKPLVMGILNVTPDSFSDGGRYFTLDRSLARVEQMIHEGVDIIDVGGESTRPGAAAVSLQEELDRVLPIVAAIRARWSTEISVDTRKPEVAHEVLKLGAAYINDVGGGRDIKLAEEVAHSRSTLIVMHMQGTPETMQENPSYPEGVMQSLRTFFEKRLRNLNELGITTDRLWIDPGIGFGKTWQQNLTILKHLKELSGLSPRIVIGTSRKGFISKVEGEEIPIPQRLPGTLASNLWAFENGASVFRVHDVIECRRALRLWEAIHASE